MKKLKKLRNKIIAMINLICSDEFYIITFHHVKEDIYGSEYRQSFLVTDDDNKIIFHTLYQNFQTEFSNRRMDNLINNAKEILK